MSQSEPDLLPHLTIKPDFDAICWTHFYVPVGTVGILQELPAPLRRKISGFIGVLIACGIEQLEIDPSGQLKTKFGNPPTHSRPFTRTLPRSLRNGLHLLAWWLDYLQRRRIAQARQYSGAAEPYTNWSCPDCHWRVNSKRAFCPNPQCTSWDKLHQCTGDPILQPVSRRA